MNKQAVKATMLALSEDELTHARQHYLDHLRDARIDRSEPVESDEQAQAELASELAVAFDQPLHSVQEKIEKLKNIDFGAKDRVEEGAIIKIADRHFVIAVSTNRFECEGVPLIGISAQVPLYSAIEGKAEGEMCEFNGRKLSIDRIW